MKTLSKQFSLLMIIGMVFLLNGCSALGSLAPHSRSVSWTVPENGMGGAPAPTYKQVMDAALQAGNELGLKLSTINRETGNINFTQTKGSTKFDLSISLQKRSVMIHGVPTTKINVDSLVSTANSEPMGVYEDFMNQFHSRWFGILKITSYQL